MGMYSVIGANEEQIKKFYEKHMKPRKRFLFLNINPIIESSAKYSYDNEDGIGFFSVSTLTGKKISCQIRRGEPMFVELTGYGSIRYDIAYPSQLKSCPEFYSTLKILCERTEKGFWKGAEI
jgi:hypothetical protein